MDRLVEILAALENVAALSDDDLATYDAELREFVVALAAEERSPEVVALAAQARDAIRTLVEEHAGRTERAAELDAEFDAIVAELTPAEVEDEPEAEPEAPAAEVEVPEVEVEAEPELVTAAVEETPAPVPARRPLAEIASRVPAAHRPRAARSADRPVVTAAAGIPGVSGELTSAEQVGMAVTEVHRTSVMTATPAADGQRVPVLSVRTPYPLARQITRAMSPEAVTAAVQAAVGEMRSIVASGGVCGPAAPYYEQSVIARSSRPIRDALVQFSAPRGSVSYVPPPVLADIGTSGGSPDQAIDVITNAEDVSNTAKAYQLFDCNSASTATVQAITSRTRFGNLPQRSHPELVAAYVDNAAVMHDRIAEQQLLTAIDTASTAVSDTNAGGNDIGVARDFVKSVNNLATRARSKHRMMFTDRLQVIAPMWLAAAIQSDHALGAYPLNGEAVPSVAQVEAKLAALGVDIVWTPDGAGASEVLSTPAASGTIDRFGTTVKWRLFHPGAHLFIDGGSLDLGLTRDSTLNASNQFEMQFETFEAHAFIGHFSYVVTQTYCVSGGASGTEDPADVCDVVS